MQAITFVMYHYVRELGQTRYPRIRGLQVSEFREQLAYMRRLYNFVTLADCLAALHGDKLPENPAVLTFDDGFADHYHAAFPLLQQLGIQGWFFPSAAPVLRGEVLDVHKIHFILASTGEQEIFDAIVRKLDDWREVLHLPVQAALFAELSGGSRFDSATTTFVKRILQYYLPQPYRSRLVQELFSHFVSADEPAFAAELYMNIDQLRSMVASGMYVGSHGYRHLWLDQTNHAAQIAEIDQSLAFLGQIGADTANWVFAYPYGAYTPELIQLAKERGCALGLTTEVGIANLVPENAFRLPRLDTNDLPKSELAEVSPWTLAASTRANL
ncbi:MAG: polysaccharide deacetylase family protein [Candidatus Korobacteraceae bacterium]